MKKLDSLPIAPVPALKVLPGTLLNVPVKRCGLKSEFLLKLEAKQAVENREMGKAFNIVRQMDHYRSIRK